MYNICHLHRFPRVCSRLRLFCSPGSAASRGFSSAQARAQGRSRRTCAPTRYLGPPGANGGHFRPYPPRTGQNADQPDTFVRRHSRPCGKPHSRAEPLQSEAASAKKASETAIPGVLRMRPAPIDSMLGLVRFSSARTPLPSAETRNPLTPLAAPSAALPCIGGQNLLLEPEPLYLQRVMPNLPSGITPHRRRKDPDSQ